MNELKLTPITEDTFKRQGWMQHNLSDLFEKDDSKTDSKTEHCFYTLPIPKSRKDIYAPNFISNSTDQIDLLKEIGLKPNQFFIEIMNMDGLGFCASEEELEVLYQFLTGKHIEETDKNEN